MAEGVTNLNTPPPPDQQVVETEKGALGRLAEKWRAWFTALGEVLNWHVTGDLDVDGAITGASLDVPVGGIMGSNPVLYVRDEKASGTGGGNSAAGAWTQRVLNTTVRNQFTGAGVTSGLAVGAAGANQVLIPAGTYWAKGRGAAYNPQGVRMKLFNVTAGADLTLGFNGFAGAATNAMVESGFDDEFTVTVPTVVELRYWVNNAVGGAVGLGQPSTTGSVEIYGELWLWQLAAA